MADGANEVLVFELAGQRFGLPGGMVRELLRAVLITPLPRSAEFVEGVISIRGKIVRVLDLRKWLGMPAKPLEPSDHIVVVAVGARVAALRVDRAVELARLPGSANVNSAPADSNDPVAQFPYGLVLLPDLEPLLADAEHAAPPPEGRSS